MNAAQEADRNALAVDRRHGRDPEVEVPFIDPDPRPAVLRQSPFGDIEVRQYFDARNDRFAEIGGKRSSLEQNAVDTPPERHPAAARLDMEIGRASRSRFPKGAVDE